MAQFKDLFTELRRDTGLSQEDFAALFHQSGSTISSYETGRNQPSFDMLIQYADYFNVTTDYLLGRVPFDMSPSVFTDSFIDNVTIQDVMSDLKTATIRKKLADMIYSTSVTIVIISPHMKESNWIDWEIEYSLTQTTRNDRTSRINGVVGVVMKVNGGYDWFIHPRINCHGTQVVTYDNSLLYPIISNNHFNSEPEQWHCSQCKTFDWLNGSYIEYVKEEDFLLNPSMYVENAYTKSQNGGAGYRLQRTRKN